MSFHDDQFPTNIGLRSGGGPTWNNLVSGVGSGAEEIVAIGQVPRRSYNAVEDVRSLDDMSDLLDFAIARNGNEHTFPFKDFWDFTTAPNHRDAPTMTDVSLGAGDGSKQEFQLLKRYERPTNSPVRNIVLPIVSTVLVALDGVSTTSFTTDRITGKITITPAPGAGVVVSAGCEFDTHVRFQQSLADLFRISRDGFEHGSVPDEIPMIEVVNELALIDEDYNYGSGGEIENGALDFSINLSMGRALRLAPTASVSCKLPAANDLPYGGIYFELWNDSANTITLLDGATTVATLTSNQTALMCIFPVSGVRTWKAIKP